MAVELAKVSLWLDAFTLGAPLSFLDHHLRCGNSLVGATFDDLEKATAGHLFRLDYGPLLRGDQIRLFVSKIADATAAEVASSVSQYYKARKASRAIRSCSISWSPPTSVCPRRRPWSRTASDLDLTDREQFLNSLNGREGEEAGRPGRGAGRSARPAILPLGDRVP